MAAVAAVRLEASQLDKFCLPGTVQRIRPRFRPPRRVTGERESANVTPGQ